MDGYKVSTLDQMGFEVSEKYYLRVKDAEKDFYNRLRDAINNESLAKREDLDGGRPWKIETAAVFDNHVLRAYFHTWTEYHTDCGMESDIVHNEIVIKKIEIEV